MANYEGTFTSSAIEVKDAVAFEEVVKLLGFKRNGDNNEDALYEVTYKDGEIFVAMFGYASVPDYIEACPCEKKCELCPIRAFFSYEEDGEERCKLIDDKDSNYDLSAVIQAHIKPGTKAVLFEIGHEKLRYVNAVKIEITSEEINQLGMGAAWHEIAEP